MKVKSISLTDSSSGEIKLSESIFGREVRLDIIHRVVNWQLAKRQSGTHSSKNRSDVTGSQKKLFRQKGTGNARTGNAKSPHKRSGGVAMGPVVRSHAHKLPKKIRKIGLLSALSLKYSEGLVSVLTSTSDIPSISSSNLSRKFSASGVGSVLVVTSKSNVKLNTSLRNLKNVDFISPEGLNVYDILNHKSLLISDEVMKKLEERLDG